MDFATRNWFGYINENIRLDEGLRDIGLSEVVADGIEARLMDAPEKAKTWVGHMWKKTYAHQVYHMSVLQEFRFETMNHLLELFNYETGGAKEEELDEPTPATPEGILARAGVPLTEEEAQETEAEMEARVTKRTQNLADRSRRIKFILGNINKVIKDEPLGKWNRAFKKAVKNLGKLSLNSEKIDKTQNWLQGRQERIFIGFYNRFDDVFTFLNMHPQNFEVLKDETNMGDAANVAEEEMAEQEDPDQILHEFADGSYWYDLDTDSCNTEGERMGHCGSAQSGGSLYSLRKPEGKRGKSKSFVTIEFDGSVVYQIKGRGNDVPPKETYPAIAWFLNNQGVDDVQEQGEYSSEPDNFEDMIFELQKLAPNVTFGGGRESKIE